MKNLLPLLFSLLVFGITSAQTDTGSYYMFTMKDGKGVAGKILEENIGKYIRLRKTDGLAYTIDWSTIKRYERIKAELSIPELKEYEALITERNQLRKELRKSKRLPEPADLHKLWDKCMVINGEDTVHLRAEYKGHSPTITIAHKDEEEEDLSADRYDALLIQQGGQWIKYIPVCDDGGGCYPYQVIVEGKCQLLYFEIVQYSAPAVAANGSMPGWSQSGVQGRYFLYYKDLKKKVRTEDEFFHVSAFFKKKCREIFSDCPALVQKIENETLRSNDLIEIVEGFNNCIEGK